jgi:phage-related protein
MLNHTFTFNGHSSDEFGIKIERFRALNRPVRKYDAATVPGRNGNIYKLQDAWEEQLISYEIFASEPEDIINLIDMQRTEFTRTATGYIINHGAFADSANVTYNTILKKGTLELVFGDSGNRVTAQYQLQQLVSGTWTTISTELSFTGTKTFDIPTDDEYRVKYILSLDGSAYTNYPITVDCRIIGRFSDAWTDIMEWLHSASSYAELSDTYDPTHYREAVFVDATDIANSWNQFGRAVVSFRCRPERFLNGYKSVAVALTTRYGLVSSNFQFQTVYSSASTSSAQVGTVTNIPFKILSESSGWYKVELNDGTQGYVETDHIYTAYGGIFDNPTSHIAKPMITAVTGTLPSGTEGDCEIILCDDLDASPTTWVSRNVKFSYNYYYTMNGQEICINSEDEDITSPGWSNLNSYVTVTDSDGNVTARFAYLSPGENLIMCKNTASFTMDARIWEI